MIKIKNNGVEEFYEIITLKGKWVKDFAAKSVNYFTYHQDKRYFPTPLCEYTGTLKGLIYAHNIATNYNDVYIVIRYRATKIEGNIYTLVCDCKRAMRYKCINGILQSV